MGGRDPRPHQAVRRERRSRRCRAAASRAGCAFGYLGPNGAGKTTLIRTLLGLTRADGGTMSLLGIPVPAEREQALARVGAIVDEPRFHPHLTGRENLRLLAAARGGDANQRIAPSLARVGLADRADDKVASYSMGMRQRLGVAVVPARRPRAADPGRADERARPGRHARDADDDREPGRRGPDGDAVVAPARRGGADLRRGRDRRPRPGHPPGPDRRAGPRRGRPRRAGRLRRPGAARPASSTRPGSRRARRSPSRADGHAAGGGSREIVAEVNRRLVERRDLRVRPAGDPARRWRTGSCR